MTDGSITVKDRVAFALWLSLNAESYFKGFHGISAVYDWLRETVSPWVAGLVGSGTIQDDALDAALIRTIHASAQQHFGIQIAARDPVLTALGEGNNAGRHVAERSIGLAEIPLLYPDKHSATLGIVVNGLAEALGKKYGISSAERSEYQTTEGGVPWTEEARGEYALDSEYKAPSLIQALMDKDFTEERAVAVRMLSEPESLEGRVAALEARIEALEAMAQG